MSLGTDTWAEINADPFAVFKALREHRAATKRMTREIHEKVLHESKLKEERRRQEVKSQTAITQHLTKMRNELSTSTAGAPPNAAALFDIETKDPRRPHPHHKGCEIVRVRDWVANGFRVPHAPAPSMKTVALDQVSRSGDDGDFSPLPLPLTHSHGGAPFLRSALGENLMSPGVQQTPRTQRNGQHHPSQPSALRSPMSGGGGGGGGTLIPLQDGGHQYLGLPSIDRITARTISNAENDFSLLSYGYSHAHIEVFQDLPDDLVLDLSGRRIPVIQFLQFFKRHELKTMSFPQYVHVVYAVPIEDCVNASRRWSTQFGWAADLCEPTAKLVLALWNQWTSHGEEKFTEAKFLQMQSGLNDRDDRKLRELRKIFSHADSDGDGVLDRDEFSRFFSGGETR